MTVLDTFPKRWGSIATLLAVPIIMLLSMQASSGDVRLLDVRELDAHRGNGPGFGVLEFSCNDFNSWSACTDGTGGLCVTCDVTTYRDIIAVVPGFYFPGAWNTGDCGWVRHGMCEQVSQDPPGYACVKGVLTGAQCNKPRGRPLEQP
jgi:hypothetical protein